MALLARELNSQKYDIALIQEPYLYRGQIQGLGKTGGTIFNHRVANVRTCVYVRNGIDAIPLHSFCSRDLTTVRIINRNGEGGRTLIVASAYLPYESEEPASPKLRELTEHCSREDLNLVIGCDANAHHITWGSTGTNKRGEKLMEYLVSSPLFLVNTGNRPTFINRKRAEVIDITLATKGAYCLINGWNVPNEISLSDHRYIHFRYSTHLEIQAVRR